MSLSMPPAPQMTAPGAGAWGMPMTISSPTVLTPNGVMAGNGSEQQRGRRKSRSTSTHSHESGATGGGNGSSSNGGFEGYPAMPPSTTAPPHAPPMEGSWIHISHPNPHAHGHVQGMMVASQSMPLPQLHSPHLPHQRYGSNHQEEGSAGLGDVNDMLADAILKRPRSLRAASSNGDLVGLREENEVEMQEVGADDEGVVDEGEKRKNGKKKKKQRPLVFTFPSLSNIGNVVKEQAWSSGEEDDEDDDEERANDSEEGRERAGEAVIIDEPPFSGAGDVVYESSGSAGRPPSSINTSKDNAIVVNGPETLTHDTPALTRRTSGTEDLRGRSAVESTG
jgi:hypothetical protein